MGERLMLKIVLIGIALYVLTIYLNRYDKEL
jgi:hypothetical protein